MATESVTGKATKEARMDRFKVEDELMKAAALADILVCAGTGDISPKGSTITVLGDLLAHIIENVHAEIFNKPKRFGVQVEA
jgi:hypothetical protein